MHRHITIYLLKKSNDCIFMVMELQVSASTRISHHFRKNRLVECVQSNHEHRRFTMLGLYLRTVIAHYLIMMEALLH